MIELDGDEERISSQGRYAERDIVQVQSMDGFPFQFQLQCENHDAFFSYSSWFVFGQSAHTYGAFFK